MIYAQIDENNVCVGISQVAGEINSPNHILLEEYDDTLLRKVYLNNQWTDQVVELDLSDPNTPVPAEVVLTRMSKLKFNQRFTFEELVAIETAAESNPGIRVFQSQLSLADYIDLVNQNTIDGVNYLVSLNLLTQERANNILTL
jgi:hypothetical protein